MSVDVLLVCPPFLSVVRPSLGLGLLKAALSRIGVACRVEYLNIAFADRIGIDAHEALAGASGQMDLLGEWIFAQAAAGGRCPAGGSAYLAQLRRSYPADQVRRLLDIRKQAASFVEGEAARLAASRPRIIGFSSSFQQNCGALALALAIRDRNPEPLLCIGGANCEGMMGRGLIDAFPQIDYVFSGEADTVFPAFVRAVLAGGAPPALPGLVARPGTTGPMDGAAPPTRVVDLDALPVPEFDDYFEALDRASFRERIAPGLTFESSRGCWWGQKQHCRFCGLNGSAMTFRTKSAARVRSEIDSLSARWGVSRFLATDNIMALDHVDTVFGPLAADTHGYRFFYETKANLRRTQLERLAEAGVTWIQPGIESLDDDILRLMRKGVSALRCIALLRDARALGMNVIWTFLYGFPGESAKQYSRVAASIPLIEHLHPPHDCTPIRLDRFSPYFNEAGEHGYTDVRPLEAYRAVYALPDEAIARIAYYFRGANDRLPAGDYAEPLIAASSAWRAQFFGSAEPPRLAMRDAGMVWIVEDTRACAVQRWRALAEDERALLERLIEPCGVANALSEQGRERAGADAAFARLVAWKYVAVDGDRAVSLVTAPPAGSAAVRENADFPGGALLPPPREPVTRLRAAAG